MSQRHLSCIETGRAQPTRGTLMALLDALDARCPSATPPCWPRAWRRRISSMGWTHRSSARRAALQVPALAARVQRLQRCLPSWPSPPAQAPLLLTRLRSRVGELRLFSMFSSFGAPLDVTLASLRIEHLFAADEATTQAFSARG